MNRVIASREIKNSFLRFGYRKQIETRLSIYADLVIIRQSIIEDASALGGCEITKDISPCYSFFAFLFFSFSTPHLSLSLPLCYSILQFHFAKLPAQKCFYTQNITVNYLCAIRHTTSRQSEAKEDGKGNETGAERVTCEEMQAKLTNSLHDPTE